MKLDMVGIVVKDMVKAIEFYQLLGFSLSFGDETKDYVELDNESVRISLNTKSMITNVFGFEPKSGSEGIELAFLCYSQEQVIALVEKVRLANYKIIKEPFSAPWGQFYALVRDNDETIISLFINE